MIIEHTVVNHNFNSPGFN